MLFVFTLIRVLAQHISLTGNNYGQNLANGLYLNQLIILIISTFRFMFPWVLGDKVTKLSETLNHPSIIHVVRKKTKSMMTYVGKLRATETTWR